MNHITPILAAALSKHCVRVTFDGLEQGSFAEIAHDACFRALLDIRSVLDDGSLSDFECIEEIVRVLESAGIGGGTRHDF